MKQNAINYSKPKYFIELHGITNKNNYLFVAFDKILNKTKIY